MRDFSRIFPAEPCNEWEKKLMDTRKKAAPKRTRVKRSKTVVKAAAARYMTVPELAARWHISLAAAYRLVDQGMPHLRVGIASIRLPLEAVEKYERENLIGAA
jgi:excisionase family DNA binding protein